MAGRVTLEQMHEYRDMLDDLFQLESGLTNREIEFLDSLADWEGCFTVAQAGWLQKIYDRMC